MLRRDEKQRIAAVRAPEWVPASIALAASATAGRVGKPACVHYC